jgi:hypothetical protein
MAGGDGGGPLGLLLSVTILVLIGILAFSIRLFSVSWDLPPSRLHGFLFSFLSLFAGNLFPSESFGSFNVFFGKSFIRVTFCCQSFCSIFLDSSQNSPLLLSPSLLHATRLLPAVLFFRMQQLHAQIFVMHIQGCSKRSLCHSNPVSFRILIRIKPASKALCCSHVLTVPDLGNRNISTPPMPQIKLGFRHPSLQLSPCVAC